MTKKQTPLELLGARLREIRLQRGLSQTELAKLMDVEKQTISSWETGKQPPRVGNLFRFAAAMGVNAGTLLDGLSDGLGPEDYISMRVSAASRLVPLYEDERVAGDVLMGNETYGQRRERSEGFYSTVSLHVADRDLAFRITNRANEPKFCIDDVVTIRADVTPQPGQFVMACAAGDFVFRRYVPAKSGTHVGARLRAENAMFPEIVMVEDDAILGVMGEHTTSSHD